MTYALLVLHQSRQPFRRIDLSRILNEKKVSDADLSAAKVHLSQVFGLKVLEVEGNPTHSILVRTRKVPIRTKRPLDTDLHNSLLTLTLAVVFMSGENGVNVDRLQEFFSLINMDDDTDVWAGCTLVKVKDLYTRTWVKQLYLERFDNEDILTKKTETTIGWGFRARQEFDEQQVLHIVSQVMGTTADSWRDQFARATHADQTAGQAAAVRTGNSRRPNQRRVPGQGATQRFVLNLPPSPSVRRGILSESDRINRPLRSSQSRR